ncbi:MAG: hypothetical protein EA422_10355 [Gemmatimonadales bacterium]|nr:MAG: hypothetical protein EA422_10355 [Gemmatimonadales bacterium]
MRCARVAWWRRWREGMIPEPPDWRWPPPSGPWPESRWTGRPIRPVLEGYPLAGNIGSWLGSGAEFPRSAVQPGSSDPSTEASSMRIILNLILLLGLTAAALDAQIPEGVEGTYEPHPEALKAIDQLLSPYCPGLMLSQCPVEPSRMLRDSIHMLANQGWTADELKSWMLANHGPEWQAVPDRSGAGLWAWILPPFALVAGFGTVIVVARRFSRPEDEDSDERADRPGPTPEDEARLREALRELELAEDPSFE